MGETIDVRRPTRTTDRYQNEQLTYSGVTHRVKGVLVDPGGSSEDSDGRRSVTTLPVAYGPPNADLLNADRIDVRGDTYEIDGDVADWVDPSTHRSVGVVVKLKRVAG